MVLAGMLLSDWVSFVTCWCGHMANRHSLHRATAPGKTGSPDPIYGSCAECEECKQFYPEEREDRDKLQHALGIMHETNDTLPQAGEQLGRVYETIASARQSKPHGTGRAVTPLVIADLEERRRFGTAKYGEELDLVVYFRQLIEERDRQSRRDADAIKE